MLTDPAVRAMEPDGDVESPEQPSATAPVTMPGYDFTRDQAGFAPELADLDQSAVAILNQSTVAILDAGKLPCSFGLGTMVAGLVHLVAPMARIMPLKAFRADGSADISNIVRANNYAVDHNVKVINMGFSAATRSSAVTAAVNML